MQNKLLENCDVGYQKYKNITAHIIMFPFHTETFTKEVSIFKKKKRKAFYIIYTFLYLSNMQYISNMSLKPQFALKSRGEGECSPVICNLWLQSPTWFSIEPNMALLKRESHGCVEIYQRTRMVCEGNGRPRFFVALKGFLEILNGREK